MPAITAALVRRRKQMRICLQARQRTLRRRGNLCFPQAMPTEAETIAELDALLPAILDKAFKGTL